MDSLKNLANDNLDIIDVEQFFLKKDCLNNTELSKKLLILMSAIPFMAILTYAGFFEINFLEMCMCVLVGLIGTISPYAAMKMGMKDRTLKYYIMISISLMTCMYGVYPSIGIYITLILGALVSLLYYDPSLTLFVCILDYFLMLVGRGFRLYALYGAEKSMTEVIHEWVAHCAGYTIEFLVVCPLFYIIAKRYRSQLIDKYTMINCFVKEQKKYELALKCADGVFFEYDIEKDELTYYGDIFVTGNMQDSLQIVEHVFEHLMREVQNGNILHPDDIEIFEGLLQGNRTGTVRLRVENQQEYRLLEVDSSVIYKDTIAVKIVGKIKDISEGNQEVFSVSDKDETLLLHINIDNKKTLEDKYGSIFYEAIIFRFLDFLKAENKKIKAQIKYSKEGFWLFFVNRDKDFIDKFIEKVKEETGYIYVGDDKLSVTCNTFDKFDDFENNFLLGTQEVSYEDYLQKDLIRYAFFLLENAEILEYAVNLLWDRIGNLYDLGYIRVLMGTSEQNVFKCSYEWLSREAFAEAVDTKLGEEIIISELEMDSEIYMCECPGFSEEGGIIVYKGALINSNDKEKIIENLQGVSKVCATFIGREYADNANRAKSEFLSSMSHEIRTPMNAIAGFSELILQEDVEAVVLRYAHNIKLSANNLLGIINDILDLSKIEAGKFQIVPNNYYLHDITEEVRNIINVQLYKSEVKLVTNFATNLPDGLIGDGIRIRQILINLLNNSVKFTKEGEVGMEISWMPGEIGKGILTGVIWDTGAGIKEDEIDKIFSAYEQADIKQNHAIKGTGLGLAITKELIEMMGGSIRIESVYGRGTKMIFEVPQGVFDDSPYDYTAHLNDRPMTEATGVPFTAPWARVLIVDDNRVNLEVASGLLNKYKVQIVTTTSGSEAVSILEKDSEFDLVFMDHYMPDIDGIKATQMIRGLGNPDLEKIPVVMLTANAIKGVEEQYYKAGMSGFLSKPISLNELADVMERYIPEMKRDKNN